MVSSSIVRLGDVVQPLDPKMPLWQRLKSAPIAMFPVNAKTMTLDRDRLDKAIRKTEATPRSIDWFGPNQIKVTRQKTPAARAHAAQPVASPLAQASYQQDVARGASSGKRTRPQHRAQVDSQISATAAQRISHWILVGIDREQPSIADSFEIQIDRHQPSPRRSGFDCRRDDRAEPIDTVAAGTCRFRVVGRSAEGPVEGIVAIELTEYPKVVVPRTTLARGHRITDSDLVIASIRPDKVDANQVTDPEQIVGMEVRTTLRADQPISIGNIGSPILIHRGDLVEVRVLSGGVTVKTNAKSLGDGSESDLVEIETMRPRKRLVARVVQTGLVEIVTRSPAMRYREKPQR